MGGPECCVYVGLCSVPEGARGEVFIVVHWPSGRHRRDVSNPPPPGGRGGEGSGGVPPGHSTYAVSALENAVGLCCGGKRSLRSGRGGRTGGVLAAKDWFPLCPSLLGKQATVVLGHSGSGNGVHRPLQQGHPSRSRRGGTARVDPSFRGGKGGTNPPSVTTAPLRWFRTPQGA